MPLIQILFFATIYIILSELSGRFLTRSASTFNSYLLRFAMRQILGSLLMVSFYAIVSTGFKTIFILCIPILAYIALHFKHKENTQTPQINISDIVIIILTLVFSGCFIYLTIKGDLSNGLKIPVKDQAFYSNIARGLANGSSESLMNDFSSLGIDAATSPYHYYELWQSSMFIKMFDINPLIAQSGITYSYSLMLLVLIVYGSLQEQVKSKTHILSGFLVAITFIFHREFLTYFFNSENGMDSILFDGNFKFLHIIPPFLISVLLLINGENKFGLVLFLTLIPINTATIPWVLLTAGTLSFILTIKKGLIFKLKGRKAEMAFLFTFGILLFYYIKISGNSNSQNYVKSIGGIINNILSNGLRSHIGNLILLSIAIIILKSRIGHKYRNALLFIYASLLYGLIGRAILDTNQNSFQIYKSAGFLFVFGMTMTIAIWISEQKKRQKYILLIPLFAIFMFAENFVYISHIFKPNISKYSNEYVEKLSQLTTKNPIGLKIINTEKMSNLMKNPIYAGFNEYFIFNNKMFNTIIINGESLLPDVSDNSYHAQTLRNEFMPNLIYNRLSSCKLYETNDSIRKNCFKYYLTKFKPEFMIVDKGVAIPEYISEHLKFEITDNNYSDETIYYLKN